MKLPKKFHVFHQWHFWKAANVQEDSASAEYPVVAAPYSQQDPGVMRKGICQSINVRSRQAYPEITASDIRIIQYARDFIQAPLRNFSIDMHEPKYVAMRGARTHIHLDRAAGRTCNELITKVCSELGRTIATSAISDDNFSARRSLAQVSKKWSYEQRLIKDRDNDRELHSNAFFRIACQTPITRSYFC